MEAIFLKLGAVWLAASDNGIPIPFSDENKTLWEIATDPFTRHFGFFFYAILIGLVTGMIWMKTQSTGPALSFFIVANSVMTVLVPGDVAMFFVLCIVLAAVAVFFRALTR